MGLDHSEVGRFILFGSGETGKHGRLVQEQALLHYPKPVKVAILETPAGFQPNLDVVTGKLRAFYERNLQNAKPIVTVVPARHRESAHDPDDPAIAALLDHADVIFAGPGSPTYAIHHLAGTSTLAAIRRRFFEGATIVLSSAAAVAAGALAIPVYELFKVGADPYWTPGLDLLADVGLRVAIAPHWNNAEGGADLDTSHCFIGSDRFAQLRELLPPDVSILGIDEHTAVVLDPTTGSASIQGAGSATVIASGQATVYASGQTCPLSALSAAQASTAPLSS